MSRQNHIVQKEILELTVPDKAGAMSAQEQVSELLKEKVNPALEEIFSTLVSSNETVRIDKLVIDIGTIAPDKIDSEMPEKILTRIKQELRNVLTTRKIKSRHESYNNEIKVKTIDASSGILELLIFYLQKGYLPWWHSTGKLKGNDEILSAATDLGKETLRNYLLPVLSKVNSRRRLLMQFSESRVKQLLIKLEKEFFFTAEKLFLSIPSEILTGNSKQVLTPAFYSVCLKKIAGKESINSDDEKISFLLEILYETFVFNPPDKNIESIAGIFKNSTSYILGKKNAVNGELLFFDALAAFDTSNATVSLTGNRGFTFNTSGPKKHSLNELISLLTEQTKKVKRLSGQPGQADVTHLNLQKDSFSDEDEIMVFNAGMVLLHPLLPYFFDGLGLLDESLQFKSENSLFKAVHLLQFLVGGKENCEEHDLTLNKVLCGMEIGIPVPKNMPLTDEEKHESIHLLKTVLKRWEALKTTNHEALRQTYLMRQGVLKKVGAGRKLTVERNAFDIMLERLPWQISIIKFPWSTEILHVEW